MGEPSFQLSRFIRYYKNSQGAFIESVLLEQALLLDPALELVIRQLEQSPSSVSQLLLTSQQLEPSALFGALSMLRDLGLIVTDPEQDQHFFEQQMDQPAATPVVDQVELTNVCPLKCIMCGRGHSEMLRPLGYMEVELFANLVEQIAVQQRQTKPLVLHNAGESLLHKDLEQMVRIAATADLKPELSVNPGYMPLKRYLGLVEAGLSRLVLSLDGLTEDVLHHIRGKAARFDKAQKNIDDILRHRRDSAEDQPQLVIQMLRLAANAHQHQTFLERYTGLEELGVLAFLKNLDAATDRSLWAGDDHPVPFFCRAPWRTVVVLWDGRVVPCCYDNQGELVLGDLHQESLKQIWSNHTATQLRQQLKRVQPPVPSPCDRCPHRPTGYQRPDLDSISFEPLHW